MDPDPEVGSRSPTWPSNEAILTALGLTAVIAFGVALRLARYGLGDFYEDGASHWWTAAYAVEQGQLLDPYGLHTRGYWLPGYDPLAASLFMLLGSSDILILQGLNTAAWVGAALCLFAIARPAGTPVALFATALLAASPFDFFSAVTATGVQIAVTLLLLGFLFQRHARAGHPALLWGAAAAYSVAVLFRYEAIVFVGACLLHGWWWSAGNKVDRYWAIRERPYLIAAIAVAFVVLALTWGENLVYRILTTSPPDFVYAQEQGLVSENGLTRATDFWGVWASSLTVALAFAVLGVALYLRRLEAWLVVVFAFLLTVFLFMGLGTASFRYLAPVEPFMWFMAALAVRRVAVLIGAAASGRSRPSFAGVGRAVAAGAVAGVVLSSSLAGAANTVEGAETLIALNGPLFRAADYVGGLWQDPARSVLIDSPLAAAASGLAPSRMFGSAMLPDTREDAMVFMRDQVQYVVAVNISYYPLLKLFPELSLGRSNSNFSLLYDATGWEAAYSTKTAWVYEVNRDHAVVPMADEVFLHVPTTAPSAGTKTSGLGLWRNAVELTAGAVGIASPELYADGRRYTPYSATGEPLPGGPVQPYSVTYTMFPLTTGGAHDIQAAPAVVLARYNATASGMDVRMWLEVAPSAGPFVLTANNSVSAAQFPLFANSSYPVPAQANEGPVQLWSLRNWLVGPSVSVQVDYREGLTLLYGRDGNRTAWLAQQAPPGETWVEYRFSVFGPGDPLYGANEPVTLEGPLARAGGFLASLELNGSLRVLSDWAFGAYPWVRSSAGLDADRFAPTSEVPAGRVAAMAWLTENIEYIVVVNATSDGLLVSFPELFAAQSDANFSLAFTSHPDPGAAPEPLVWVYRVNRGDGAISVPWGPSLRFVADQGSLPGGLEVWSSGQDLTAGARGLGVPTARINGTPYIAASAVFAFAPGNGGTQCTAVWTLYEEVGGMPVPSAPLTVLASYRLNGSLLTVNFTATQVPPGATLQLGATTEANSTHFPVFVNDTAWVDETSDTPTVMVGSLRNWLVSPAGVALQVDYRDPLLLFFSRDSTGTASLSFEAPDGATSLEYDVWVIPSASIPYP